jgi:hypothetical protein
MEYGALHKLLFGSDYPVTTPRSSMEGMRKINGMTRGTGLPQIPAEKIEELIQRDTVRLIGIE